MGEYVIKLYNIPMKEELMSALIENPVGYYSVGSMSKYPSSKLTVIFITECGTTNMLGKY